MFEPELSPGGDASKGWRVHHQHGDYAPEKDEEHNPESDKNSGAYRVVLLFLTAEWRRADEMGVR